MTNKLFFVTFFLIYSILDQTMAQVSPELHWKEMKLAHFNLIYDAEHYDLAKLYAARLENRRQYLTPLFPEGPEKITVVLNDRTDLTNGYATDFPYPLIMVYPVLPSPTESIGEFDDWASEILTHEYAHILAMYPRRDIVKGLSWVFGTIITPNILLPRWWHEGLAVDMETRFSQAGRLRSSEQDAWIRSYIVDNKWNDLTLAEANEVSNPGWPYGARPYLMGSLMWSEMISLKGTGLEKDLSWSYGGRLPYLINSPAEEYLGMDYADLFWKTKLSVQRRADKQIDILKKVPPTNSVSLGLSYLEGFAPSISPDGLKLAFIAKDETTRRSLRILQRPSASVPFDSSQMKKSLTSDQTESTSEMKTPLPRQDGPPGGTIQRLSWFPNSEKIAFDKVDDINRFHEASDLYTLDLKNNKSERLSYFLRAREPAVSPSGRQVVFVKVLAGKTNLETLDLDSKNVKTVFSAPLQARCSYPVYVDENKIIFSYREKGTEKLLLLDLKTKIAKPLLLDYPSAQFPHITPVGLLFTSTKNGVRNLYLSDKNYQAAKPVTNSLTEIADSDYDSASKDFYITEQTSHGLTLRRLEKSEYQKLPKTLSHVDPLFADRYPKSQPVSFDSAIAEKAPVEDYSSFSYLLPRYWLPFFYSDSYTNYFSISTSGADPLGKQAWSLYGLLDTKNTNNGSIFSYDNNATVVEVLALASDITATLPGNLAQRAQLDHIEATLELTSIDSHLKSSLGWTTSNNILTSANSSQSGPSLAVSYFDYSMSGAEISPETGFGGKATATSFLPGPGLTQFNQLELSLVKYFSSFLPARHVLMTKFQSLLIDRPVSSVNFALSSSLPYYANTYLPQYIMRGYPTGAFQGRMLNQATFEYRFPIRSIYSGEGTTPLFIKRLHGGITLDGINLEGYGYDFNSQAYRSLHQDMSFWTVGAEIKADITLGYQIPMTWYMGYYFPADSTLNQNPNLAIGLFL